MATLPALIERRSTLVAADQGRVTAVRSDVTVTAQGLCEGDTEPFAYTTAVDFRLTG